LPKHHNSGRQNAYLYEVTEDITTMLVYRWNQTFFRTSLLDGRSE